MVKIISRFISWIEKHQAAFSVILTAFLVVATTLLWISTRALWVTTKEAIQESKRASWGTIILTANRDFFFNDRMYKVRKVIESKKPIFREKGGTLTEQDIDDYIGFFDMLYGFTEQKILDFKIMDNNFGIFVDEAYDNKEIRRYISDLRKEYPEEDIYIGFENWAKKNIQKNRKSS
jgi:hypothetical protein